MILKYTPILVALGLLAGCTSPAEKQGLTEVGDFYGGNVAYSKGSNVTTAANEPQGKYFEVKLSGAGLNRRFSNLHLPASNCAYLVYRHLAPTERQDYSYFKVTLADSGTTHSYSFPQPELQAATQAAASLPTLMKALQQHNYLAVANAFNPAAQGNIAADSLPAVMTRLCQRIGPVREYALHGYEPISVPLAGKPEQLMRLFVAVGQPAPARRLLIVINPRLQANQQFLYGMSLLK